MRHEHTKTGWEMELVDGDALHQRDVEKYMAEFRKGTGETRPEMDGRTVRAALKAGWVTACVPPLKAEDVGDVPPARVRWMAMRIDALYAEVLTVPPE